MTHLTLGDFDAGWKAYEWRWKTGAFARYRRPFQTPPWLGDEPISGKTILLHAEQGFGDTLQFIRYAPLLAGQGAKVICEVQPELLPLLSQLPDITVLASGERLPAFDLHCPLLSLPLACGTQPGTIPAAIPYLAAPAERVAALARSFAAGASARRICLVRVALRTRMTATDRSRLRVSPGYSRIRRSAVSASRASCELRMARPWLACRTWSISAAGFAISPIPPPSSRCSTSSSRVDTAVAHLAGALGKPVLILLPHAADFRWMRNRDDNSLVSDGEVVAAAGLWRLGQRGRSRARRIAAIELARHGRAFGGGRRR